MDCGLLGFSVHEILQARILEWEAIPFSRESSPPRDWTEFSQNAVRFFTFEPLRKPLINSLYIYFSTEPKWFDLMWLSGKESACQCKRCKRWKFDPWVGRRKWHPTPVFFPGKSHGQRSLAGYNPWGLKRLDVTERICMPTIFNCMPLLFSFISCWTQKLLLYFGYWK